MENLLRFVDPETFAEKDNCEKDWQTPLLNNLFSTVENLRNELKEKNIQINKLLCFQDKLLNKQEELLDKLIIKDSISTPSISSIKHSSCSSIDDLPSITSSPNNSVNDTEPENVNDTHLNRNVTTRKRIMSEKNNANENQLNEIRSLKHNEYIKLSQKGPQTSFPWPKNTVLVASDSIFNNVEEHRLSKKYNVKVRAFSGATVTDMFDYITPLLRKKPDIILLHVGTNDTSFSSADEILKNIEHLTHYIRNNLPSTKVIVSTPTIRSDNGKANLTTINLAGLIKNSGIDFMDNSNIHSEHLGRKGLHLNSKGTGRLAMNTINLLRKL